MKILRGREGITATLTERINNKREIARYCETFDPTLHASVEEKKKGGKEHSERLSNILKTRDRTRLLVQLSQIARKYKIVIYNN